MDVRSGAVFQAQPQRARLRLTGRDAAAFLHNMTTNDIKGLAAGAGAPAAIVNQRAGVLDHGVVYRLPDGFVLIGGPGRAESDLAWLDRYLITEDVTLEDLAGATSLLFVTGAGAQAAVEAAFPVAANLQPYGARAAGDGTWVLATDGSFGPGYHLLVPTAHEAKACAALRAGGAALIDDEALEAARIAWGLPAVGAELVETRNPWEGRLDGSVSLSKGCYLGQEVVARLNAYEKVQRYLVGLSGPGAPPAAGTPLSAEDRPVGEVTSAAATPEGFVALAYVKAAFAAPGTPLHLEGRREALAAEDRPFWAGRTRPETPPSRA